MRFVTIECSLRKTNWHRNNVTLSFCRIYAFWNKSMIYAGSRNLQIIQEIIQTCIQFLGVYYFTKNRFLAKTHIVTQLVEFRCKLIKSFYGSDDL